MSKHVVPQNVYNDIKDHIIAKQKSWISGEHFETRDFPRTCVPAMTSRVCLRCRDEMVRRRARSDINRVSRSVQG